MSNPIVITPVATEPVTLAEARLHIKADTDTSEDALISAWIGAARETAEHYTGLSLAPQTLELALDSFPDGAIKLPRGPVTSITSVIYIDASEDSQTVSDADYALDDYSTPLWAVPAHDTSWPSTLDAANAVKVRYVAGYAACPNAAKAAILLMVAWLNENRGDSIQPDDIQPPAAKSLLNTIKVWGR
jgi:uncharacterized phiE125 gp8 family phage protein